MQDHVSRVVGFEGFDVNAVSEEGGRRALKVEVAARARLLPRAVGRRAISRSGPVVRAYDLPIAGGGRSECGEIAASAARVVGGRSPTYRSWPRHVRLTRRFGDVCPGVSAKYRRTPRSRARSRRPATRSPTRSGLAAATPHRGAGAASQGYGCPPCSWARTSPGQARHGARGRRRRRCRAAGRYRSRPSARSFPGSPASRRCRPQDMVCVADRPVVHRVRPDRPVDHLGRAHSDVEDVGRFVGDSCDVARSSAGPTASCRPAATCSSP
jgi:hypothetical protein